MFFMNFCLWFKPGRTRLLSLQFSGSFCAKGSMLTGVDNVIDMLAHVNDMLAPCKRDSSDFGFWVSSLKMYVMLQARDQHLVVLGIQISAFLDAGFLAHRQPHSFTYHLWLLLRCNGWVGKLGQIVSPGEPEIFPTWPFTEGISQPYPVIRPWDPLSCIISATHFADKETEAQHR